MKILKVSAAIAIAICCYHLLVTEIVYSNPVDDSTILSIQQDLVQDLGAQQDSSKIQKDSLEKLVPYLDDVKADSKNELLLLYMLAIILSTLISEDLACIGAGMMAANGLIDFWPAASAAIMGIYIGDFTLYFAGRLLGKSIFNVAPFKWFINEQNVDKSVEWFKRKGPVMLIVSRFIPGSRIPAYLSAGILKTGFWTFFLYFGVTTLLWTPVFVWISVFAGNEVLAYYEAYDDYAIWIIIGAILLLWVLFRGINPLFTKRGRRIFWRRIRKYFD